MMDLRHTIQNLDIEKRFRERGAAFLSLSARYRDDPEFRDRLDRGDNAEALAEADISVPPGVEVRFAVNTPDTFHLVMPMDPNAGLSDESLGNLAAGTGGKSAAQASAYSATSAGCYGCSSNFSSQSSASSQGTIVTALQQPE